MGKVNDKKGSEKEVEKLKTFLQQAEKEYKLREKYINEKAIPEFAECLSKLKKTSQEAYPLLLNAKSSTRSREWLTKRAEELLGKYIRYICDCGNIASNIDGLKLGNTILVNMMYRVIRCSEIFPGDKTQGMINWGKVDTRQMVSELKREVEKERANRIGKFGVNKKIVYQIDEIRRKTEKRLEELKMLSISYKENIELEGVKRR